MKASDLQHAVTTRSIRQTDRAAYAQVPAVHVPKSYCNCYAVYCAGLQAAALCARGICACHRQAGTRCASLRINTRSFSVILTNSHRAAKCGGSHHIVP